MIFYGKDRSIDLSDLKAKKVTLVTGIADPSPLLSHLECLGLTFEHLSYPDHHFFNETEIKALNEKEVVLTTEKDYMRLKENVSDLYFIRIRHEFSGKDAGTMTTAISSFMKQDT